MTRQTDAADWPAALDGAIGRGSIALFVGAGISRDAPSCLPTGDALRDMLFDGIVDQREVPQHLLKAAQSIAGRCRPEVLLYMIEEWAGADWREALTFMLGVPPNANHRIISSLVGSGQVKCILTTNFDCLIESAMEERVRFDQIASAEDFASYTPSATTIPILKLHGSIADSSGNPTPETLLGSLVDVANRIAPSFTAEKASALAEILSTHIVIFLGYSGRDEFDIGPVIEKTPARQIIWVKHEKPLAEAEIVNAVPDGSAEDEHLAQLKGLCPNMIVVRANTCRFLVQLHLRLTGRKPARNALPTDDDKLGHCLGEGGARQLSIAVSKSPYSFMALALRMAHEWQLGEEASQLAIVETEEHFMANPHNLPEDYRHRGICRKELGHLDGARSDFSKARILCEQLYSRYIKASEATALHQAHFAIMSQLCEDLALTDLKRSKLEDAEAWIRKAISWSKRLVYPRQVTFVSRNFSNASLIAMERFLQSGDSSHVDDALQLAAASAASAVSGSCVEFTRALSNWAWLLVKTQQWEQALPKGLEAITQSSISVGLYSSQEVSNRLAAVVISLCALAATDAEARKRLQHAERACSHVLGSKSTDTILSLFRRARKAGLCFPAEPAAAPACLRGVLDLVHEGRPSTDSTGNPR